MSTLIALSGLPGVGKTTLARRVAAVIGAVHVRLDTIEAAMMSSGVIGRAGGWECVPGAGYEVACALASDLLRAGHDVVADSVNPIDVTRRAWAASAESASAELVDVEVVCTDLDRHRSRVEERTSDLVGLTVPTWAQVQNRDYQPWDSPTLRVDTVDGVDAAVAAVAAVVQPHVRD